MFTLVFSCCIPPIIPWSLILNHLLLISCHLHINYHIVRIISLFFKIDIFKSLGINWYHVVVLLSLCLFKVLYSLLSFEPWLICVLLIRTISEIYQFLILSLLSSQGPILRKVHHTRRRFLVIIGMVWV